MAELWFYAKDGRQMGPLSSEELRQLAMSGTLQGTDLVWKEGMPDWIPANRALTYFSGEAMTSSAPLPRTLTSGERGRFDEDDDLARRLSRPPRPSGGMSTGVIVALVCSAILGLFCFVGILGVALIRIAEDNQFPAGDRGRVFVVGKDDVVVMTYNVNLQDGAVDIRDINLQAKHRYRFNVKATDWRGDMDIVLLDSKNMELTRDDLPDADASVELTPPSTGVYKIEISNAGEWINGATVTVIDLEANLKKDEPKKVDEPKKEERKKEEEKKAKS